MVRTPLGRRVAAAAVGAVMLLPLAACSSGQQDTAQAAAEASAGGGKEGPLTIAFIQKAGDQQYFIDEAEGAREEAERQGDVEVSFTNVGQDANAAINAVNAAIAQQVDAVAIVVPDTKIGPQVADLLRDADIPFVAVDDPFEDGDGKRVPWVSIESLTMGRQVGTTAGELYAAAGWSDADTRIISVSKQDLEPCNDREEGYLETFRTASGGAAPEVIRVGTDATTPQALEKVGAVVTANAGVRHWVVMGCNDESVSGALTALENAGFGGSDVIGIGLGAYLACKDWRAGKDTGFKAALNVDGRIDGAAAIKVLVESLRSGEPLPETTLNEAVMVDAGTWESAGVTCT